tara:strand:+ start:177 stop:536 length:360 start_codon:yes stop_codon:yes gene_type:complete
VGAVETENDVPKDGTLESTSSVEKLSHICIFGDCNRGKRGGSDYCRIHSASSVEGKKTSISRTTGNSGFIFVIGFFAILIYFGRSESEGFENLIYFFWGFVSLCIGIVFLLISGVSKKI